MSSAMQTEDPFDFDDGIPGRWNHLSKVLDRGGSQPDTPDNQANRRNLREKMRVLVIGAGGLGCEILKNLALSGFKNIDVIDMDTIDVSNLNRQFLFRAADVGKSKAIVAAEFVNRRVPGVQVVPHFGKIQDFDEDFYRNFALVISGLDSIEARRWINATLVSLIVKDPSGEIDTDTIIPFIDGGTEGFKGQARLIIPGLSACFECTIPMFPAANLKFPLCTIADTPRVPEHCIQWASELAWGDPNVNKVFPRGTKIDNDNPDHMTWLFEAAKKRAEAHNIQGVTYKLTQGVVKNIIPAIASTNAIIAAACCNEALKFATNNGGNLNNYMMYNGLAGVYTYTFEVDRRESCAVCGQNDVTYAISPSEPLKELVVRLAEDVRFQFKKPSLRCQGRNLYMQGLLEATTRPNLDKSLQELGLNNGDVISITDPSLPTNLALLMRVKFE
eukprot:TRINITY_DN15741_c0_g1_i2.p1 TRINITY_DN15741_c0_g1~~TRINITY_DN15741_c0_g1_i2.p1  ORF type:complete len:458 (+),score=128.47 TRINITY_DN15741_c0_g1_i2:40-1374(+)